MKNILAILFMFVLVGFAPTHDTLNIRESIITLEDMVEWIEWDIQNNDIDSLKGEMYIQNIDRVLYRLQQLRTFKNK